MVDKIIDTLKSIYTIPSILIKDYKKYNMTSNELVVVIYLLNQKDIEFNPQKISKDLNIEISELLTNINELEKKDLLKLEHIVDKTIHKEIIKLDRLYNKLALSYLDQNKEVKNVLFDKFEKEFGRTLSPMEYEIINSWSSSYSDEIIIEALKEAVYNNVSNLRYIDKILSEWNKKGIKTIKDIESDKKDFMKKNKKQLVEYDWLNENE